jgi:hypothetical protein
MIIAHFNYHNRDFHASVKIKALEILLKPKKWSGNKQMLIFL